MMNLCKLLSSKKPEILITFVVTEEWHGFMGSDQKPHNIRFATVPNLIPSELVRANDFLGFVEAVNTKLEAPVEQLLDRLELPVSTIVADPYVVWATRVASRRNIPVASLWPMSASVFSVLLHIETLEQKSHFPLNNVSEWGDDEVIADLDLPTVLNGDGLQIVKMNLEVVRSIYKAQYLVSSSVYELALLQKSKKTTVNHRRVFGFSMVVESTVIFSLINHDAK
ncbi:hypothetical protein PRUPE_6G049500 [Prunus persica]|uniref:Uncharacterized protein n=1 Tax=Prunus persica TaxID=3760 RepID=A0A251NM46_PRUPE|nr:hypothetical protein PRUPE_6G049500 [Prunus persica]